MRKMKLIGRLLLVVAAGPLAWAGCTKDKGSAASTAASTVAQDRLRQHGGHLLHAGTAPTNFLVGPAGFVTIIDATVGYVLVDHRPIAAQTAIEIHPVTGINIGSDKVVDGPLLMQHRFEIWQEQ